MNTDLINKLQHKVNIWRDSGYEGAMKETQNMLRHIYKVNYLYKPQKEALETYIYIKEVLGNKPTSNLIPSLYDTEKEFIDSLPISKDEKYDLAFSDDRDKKLQEIVEREYGHFAYPNQVYALTMGSGKTILMGTIILYEFVLSTSYPDDDRFAKNVLVFAPDTTIIESLKEIKSFDFSKVLPKEYANVALNIKYHYLESTDTSVNFLGNYNIVVSNSQKIIMKRRRTETKDQPFLLNETTRNAEFTINSRLRAIRQLENLSIIVDEAHHSYGSKGKDSLEKTLKSSRETIAHINEEGKTPLVNVVNLTGTPYVNNKLINDVVYHFGLKQGIESGILKQVNFLEYENVKNEAFVEQVIEEFVERYSGIKLEGKLPKIAFYASNIEDLQANLRPALEKILAEKGISTRKILEFHTEKEENKSDFLKLDTEESDKQFILLVGKGTEGWNVRSLVATALFRKPSSSIFVLQSSTRCMRSIGDNSVRATIFLSQENAQILDKELENNFGVRRADLEQQPQERVELELKVLKKKSIVVKKQLKEIQEVKKTEPGKIRLSDKKKILDAIGKATRKELSISVNGNDVAKLSAKQESEIGNEEELVDFYSLVTDVAYKTHLSCLEVKQVLQNNQHIDLELTEWQREQYTKQIASEILSQVFEYKEKVEVIEEELELTRNFPFRLSREKGKEGLVIYKSEEEDNRLGFHINPYAFDSKDERDLFIYLQEVLEPDEAITDIYFTGNISDATHSDFYFEYWNPRSERHAKYFPDFLIETSAGRFIVIEVKGDNERTDYQANKKSYTGKTEGIFNEVFAKEVGFNDFQKLNDNFTYQIVFNAGLQQKQKELLEKIN
jgi:superfamily II DNA or RNA helicase